VQNIGYAPSSESMVGGIKPTVVDSALVMVLPAPFLFLRNHCSTRVATFRPSGVPVPGSGVSVCEKSGTDGRIARTRDLAGQPKGARKRNVKTLTTFFVTVG
jgi:hypothetical protein